MYMLLITQIKNLKMNNYSLIVVDVQYRYRSPAKNILKQVCKEIENAKKFNCNIFIVAMNSISNVYDEIIALTKIYKNVYKIVKNMNNGSEAILKRGIIVNGDNIRICGVNTGICVCQTAFGLQSRLPNSSVKLIENACSDYRGSYFSNARNAIRSNIDLEINDSNLKVWESIGVC